MTEEFRAIPGYAGLFEVSNIGTVRSLDKAINGQRRPGKLLRPYANRKGNYLRLQVRLCLERKRYARGVGALVLEAFVGPRPDGMECCHINGDGLDNRVENLRWDTHSENVLDTMRQGTHFAGTKTHCPQRHPYDAVNTYVRPSDGKRFCRACGAIHRAKYLARVGQ